MILENPGSSEFHQTTGPSSRKNIDQAFEEATDMRTSASQTPPTKYQAFLEERGQLPSKNFTGTERERQIGKILVPKTAKMDN